MKEEVSESEFINRFETMNRGNNFTYEGRRALYEYITQLEEDTGTDIDLDIIAICCDYNEYEDLDEYLKDYNTDLDKKDYDDEEEFKDAVMEEIQEKTTLIKVSDEGFIIQAY